jgi:CRISPR-associated endoribonuclease Cas6
MRITMILKALRTVSQRDAFPKYYAAMQGFVYDKLKNSVFADIHNKNKFKNFCFSNLVGVKHDKVLENHTYKITISSPNVELMNVIRGNLKEGEIVNLGEFSFELMGVYNYEVKLDNFCVIETPTIIVVTERVKGRIKSLDFMEESEKERYLYLLGRNLIKKYNSFNGSKIDEDYDLWKNVMIEPILKGKYSIPCESLGFKFIGNKLRFKLGYLDDIQKKVFNHCFEAGFGTYCGYGMGFIVKEEEFNDLNSLDDFNKLLGK